MKYAVAIDIGGTNTRVALINEMYGMEKRIQFETYIEDPYKTLDQITNVIRGFDKNVEGIGMSCPGPLDLMAGQILTTPNLKGAWRNLLVRKELESRIHMPVYLENDANLAALAEAVIGEGKDKAYVQFLTVSTGLGAGFIAHKKIYHGAHGFANEVANTVMKLDGPSHGSIYPDGIEAISSGTAIVERARKAGLEVEHAGNVNELAKAGHLHAAFIMMEAKIYLANFIASLINVMDPDLVIVGGSVALKIDGFVEEVETLVKERVYDVVAPYVKVRKSTLDEDSGLLGAACLVFTS